MRIVFKNFLCCNFDFRFVFYSFELSIEKLPIQIRLIKLITIIHCHSVPLIPTICQVAFGKSGTQDDNFQTNQCVNELKATTIVNSDAENRILKSK